MLYMFWANVKFWRAVCAWYEINCFSLNINTTTFFEYRDDFNLYISILRIYNQFLGIRVCLTMAIIFYLKENTSFEIHEIVRLINIINTDNTVALDYRIIFFQELEEIFSCMIDHVHVQTYCEYATHCRLEWLASTEVYRDRLRKSVQRLYNFYQFHFFNNS